MKNKPSKSIHKLKIKNLVKNNKKLLKLMIISSLLILPISLYYYLNTHSQINRLIKNKNYTKAIKLINNLLKKNANDPFALKAKGQVYFITTLYNLNPNDNEKLLDQSIKFLLLLQKNNKEYIKSDTYFFIGCLHFIKAQLYQNEYYYTDALKYLKKSYKLNQKDKETKKYIKENGFKLPLNEKLYSISLLGLIGYISYNTGDYNKAVLYFEKAVKEKSSPYIYYLYLALAYKEMDNYNKAIENMLIVINNEKKTDILEQSYYILSKIFILKKEYSKAEKYIKKIQQLFLTAESYYQLGLIYEAKNNLDKAIGFWKSAIKKDPNHSGSIQKLLQFVKKKQIILR